MIGPSVGCKKNYPSLFRYLATFIFFRNKTFLFIKIDSWKLKCSVTLLFRILWNPTKFQLIWTIFRPHEKMLSECCLNELKVCEVSQKPKPKRFWQFQLLFQKKVCAKLWFIFSTNRWRLMAQFWREDFEFIYLNLMQAINITWIDSRNLYLALLELL